MNLEILWESNLAFYDLSTFMPNMINENVKKSYLQEKNSTPSYWKEATANILYNTLKEMPIIFDKNFP